MVDKGEENIKRHFVPAPGDGPEYKFSGGRKGEVKISSLGKDAKGTPVSYLPISVWGVKKEEKETAKTERASMTGRKSFIDAIFFYGNKYKYPGPNQYFALPKKGSEKKQEKPKEKEKEKTEKMNFLMDYQYLGMNIPGPGEYPMKDPWAEIANKKKQAKPEEDKKKANPAEGWKGKNNKGQGPGQYDIVRLLSVTETKESGGKQLKKFQSIPIFERTTLGIINKGHDARKSTHKISDSVSPATYFKKEGDIEKAYMRSYKPMRRY